ncbi:MAG: hypothetical protein DWQ01_07405 [Planctomycetota bacterium]|nr:MAG: hypothetical protein DWQ01_07405 [Planctomycetota bacterium]
MNDDLNPNGSFQSQDWFDLQPELRLVEGRWIAFSKQEHASSSLHQGERKPTSLAEKKAWEAEAKAAEAAAKEEGDGADES